VEVKEEERRRKKKVKSTKEVKADEDGRKVVLKTV